MSATQSPRERELRGHGTRRYQLPMHGDSNPAKLCECGCGERVSFATKTARSRGLVKGMPLRFISGHNSRGRILSEEGRAKIAAKARGRTGPSGAGWRGGSYLIRGRKMVWVGREHPMADRGGHVLEYRLVLASALGRFLSSDEHVHHVDLDETNNAVSNLVVLTRSEHGKVHALIVKGASPLDALRQIVEGS